MTKRKFIDPPWGWKYGFPKEIPDNIEDSNILEWLVENGYPKKELELFKGILPYRVWFKEIK